jgi:hypothetical protein
VESASKVSFKQGFDIRSNQTEAILSFDDSDAESIPATLGDHTASLSVRCRDLSGPTDQKKQKGSMPVMSAATQAAHYAALFSASDC